MEEQMHYHRYQLHSAGGLNAVREARTHEGLLILVSGGAGCIHPWEEFGDLSVDGQLAALRAGKLTPLIRRALDCCREDGGARARGASLFQELEIPPSHLVLSPSLNEGLWRAEAELAARDGFSMIKVKCGSDPVRERAFLAALGSVEALRFRLDFNAGGDVSGFLEALPGELRRRVDFIEDPMPFDLEAWKDLKERFGMRIARDFEQDPGGGRAAYDLRVLKPAREPVTRERISTVITTVMDHPIGQMFAAWEAARYDGPLEHCGLATHLLFEPDEFSDRIQMKGNRLLAPEGTGLGFDDLLAGLQWERV